MINPGGFELVDEDEEENEFIVDRRARTNRGGTGGDKNMDVDVNTDSEG